MRVIGGTAKNHRIIAPEGMATRPITDQIKESLFNMWQFDIEGCDFLDLFSGSGAMGIEAMSRGANYTVMIDKGYEPIMVIKKNITSCKLEKCAHQVIKDDVLKYLKRETHTFDIIYCDPPFTVPEIFEPVMIGLSNGKLLKKDGFIAIRSSKDLTLQETYGNIVKYKEKRYGVSTVHFYKLKEETL